MRCDWGKDVIEDQIRLKKDTFRGRDYCSWGAIEDELWLKRRCDWRRDATEGEMPLKMRWDAIEDDIQLKTNGSCKKIRCYWRKMQLSERFDCRKYTIKRNKDAIERNRDAFERNKDVFERNKMGFE